MTTATVTPSFNINGMVVDDTHQNYPSLKALMARKTAKQEAMKELKGDDLVEAKEVLILKSLKNL